MKLKPVFLLIYVTELKKMTSHSLFSLVHYTSCTPPHVLHLVHSPVGEFVLLKVVSFADGALGLFFSFLVLNQVWFWIGSGP